MRIAVLGAGLSGLAAAYRLSRLWPTASVVVLEASQRAGGWANSHRQHVAFVDGAGVRREGDVISESGVRSLRPRGGSKICSQSADQEIADLGLLDSVIAVPKTHPAAKNRYILDATSATIHRVGLSLFSSHPAIRALPLDLIREPFRRRRRAHAPGTPDSEADDESVLSFLSRRLPAATPLVSAFTHGIYAASPALLSVRACFPSLFDAERDHGSIVLGMLRGQKVDEGWSQLGALGTEREKWSLYGLQGGLQTLPDTLQRRLTERGVSIQYGQAVEKLAKTANGVEVQTSSGPLAVDHVVSALPPRILAAMTSLPHLTANPSTSVGVINVTYACPPSTIHPPGFGYLIPHSPVADNREGALGVVFDSSALPGSDGALDGHITRLTVMLGGPYWSTYDPLLPIPAADKLPALAMQHLHRVFPALKQQEPLLVRSSLNTNCIPTYTVGHGQRMRALHEAIAEQWEGRLSVSGSGYAGISANDCVASGEVAAEGIVQMASGGPPVTGLEKFAAWQ